jgi:hypothetical protein
LKKISTPPAATEPNTYGGGSGTVMADRKIERSKTKYGAVEFQAGGDLADNKVGREFLDVMVSPL